MYWANPPGMLMPNALNVAHIWVLPLTHMSQTPQPMLGAMATAIPLWYPVTPSPTSSTTPLTS